MNPPLARFFAKTKPNGDCLEWTGSKRRGYGLFRAEGRVWSAHRYMWLMMRGPIRKGMKVLHRCDNPSCVRIEHLWIGTQRDNCLDRDSKGRRGVRTGGWIPAGRGHSEGRYWCRTKE